MRPPVVYLLDVDNTLFDSDRLIADLMRYCGTSWAMPTTWARSRVIGPTIRAI